MDDVNLDYGDWPDWKAFDLPEGESRVVAVCTAPSGELFLATANRVYIRSPYGSNGWEVVAGAGSIDGTVAAIAPVTKTQQAVMLVVTDKGAWEVTWTQDRNRWPGYRYTFNVKTLKGSLQEPAAIFPISSEGTEQTVLAYVTSRTGSIEAVTMGRDGLEFSHEIRFTDGTGEPQVIQIGNGRVACYVAREPSLFVLKPDGSDIDAKMDLFAAGEGVSPSTHIVGTCVDRKRGLLVAATKRRLFVAPIPSDADAVPQFLPVAFRPQSNLIGVFWAAGRIMIAAEGELGGKASVLLGESWPTFPPGDAKAFAQLSTFEPIASGGPDEADDAVQVEDDQIWVRHNSWWRWVPDRWSAAPASDALAGGRPHGNWLPGVGRIIVSDGKDRVYWAEPEGSWRVSGREPGLTRWNARWLIPDTTGRMVWSAGAPTMGSGLVGLLAARTPNGRMETKYNVQVGPVSLQVRRFAHRETDGTTHWPSITVTSR